MPTNRSVVIHVLAFIALFAISLPDAFADPSGGGAVASTVAKTVHTAAQVQALSEEFERTMAAYEREPNAELKNEWLIRAKNILSQLIAQANNVESEIKVMDRKKLDKVYATKLDRILSQVRQMRAAAEEKIRAAEKIS